MKFRNFGFFIKESFTNLLSNKWMTIASIVIVFTTLYIFGIFFLIATNIEKVSFNIEDQPMHAFTIDNANQKMAESVKKKIEKMDGVKSVKLISKEEGLEELKEKYENYEELFDGLNSDFLSYKLIVNLEDANNAKIIKRSIENLVEIEKVNYAQETMEKILKITRMIRISSYSLTIILGLISLFIIIYTIKLTVFARRREINIMKYVGATDWFIKWPFVIEGIVIGISGALIAVFFIIASYDAVFNTVSTVSSSIIKLVPLSSDLRSQLLLLFIIVGSTIGSIGSVISVKKYLYV